MDTQFAKKIRNVFPLDAYRSKPRIDLARLVYDYLDQYKEAPKDHFYDLYNSLMHERERGRAFKNRKLYDILVQDIRSIDKINKNYILDKISEAARHIRLEEAIVEAASLIKKKQYTEAERVVLDAFRDPVIKAFQYIDYLNDDMDVLERLVEEPFLMQTLIPPMDDILGGIRRQEVVVWLGTPKAGKTYGLISMAHAALLQGLSVIFVSLELHRSRIAARMDQTAGFLCGAVRPRQILTYSNGSWSKSDKRVIHSIFDVAEVQRIRRIMKKYGGQLIIASAPGGTKNYNDVRLFLDELESVSSIIPHVVIVDYLRNMKGTRNDQSRKEMIGENCRGLVQLASERDCIVFSAQQGNRKAMGSKVLKPEMIADDIDPIGYVDVLPAICQTKEEETNDEARIYIAIAREGKSGAQIKVKRDLSIGQFWMDCKLEHEAWQADG